MLTCTVLQCLRLGMQVKWHPHWFGSRPTVNFLVYFKIEDFREVFATLITTMGVLFNMQVKWLPHWFGPHSGVNLLVYFEVGHFREDLSTLITSIGFLPIVNSLVYFEVGHFSEVFSTLVTAVMAWFNQAPFFLYCRQKEVCRQKMQHWVENKKKENMVNIM